MIVPLKAKKIKLMIIHKGETLAFCNMNTKQKLMVKNINDIPMKYHRGLYLKKKKLIALIM